MAAQDPGPALPVPDSQGHWAAEGRGRAWLVSVQVGLPWWRRVRLLTCTCVDTCLVTRPPRPASRTYHPRAESGHASPQTCTSVLSARVDETRVTGHLRTQLNARLLGACSPQSHPKGCGYQSRDLKIHLISSRSHRERRLRCQQ